MRRVRPETFDPIENGNRGALAGSVFRVDKEFSEQRTRLTVSGEISPACIEVLETCCEQAIRDGKAVHLVLDITAIDERGRALLWRLAAKNVRMFAKGIYHSHLVDTIRRAASRD